MRNDAETRAHCRRDVAQSRRIIVSAALAVFSVAHVCSPACADQQDAPTIEHGKDITPAKIGPAAAGIQLTKTASRTAIKDGVAYPFAKEITGPAAYDGIKIGGPHLLIEGVSFDGPLDIYTKKPVVLRGSIVRTQADSHWGIQQRPDAGALYLLWSEVGGAPGFRTSIGLMLRGEKAVVYRSRISETLDGVRMAASGYHIVESLIDNIVTRKGDHNDGVQTSAVASEIIIEKSRIMNRNRQTSCLLLRGDRIVIRHNYLAGGGWAFYGGFNGNGHGAPNSSNMSVTGNVFGTDYYPKSGYFGAVAYWDYGRGNAWSDNTFSDGRALVPKRRSR